MGMTIEKAIEWFDGLECYTPHAKDAKDVAIETMRKYEEIEKIVEDRNGKPPLTTLNEIIMVVEEWTYYKKKLALIPIEENDKEVRKPCINCEDGCEEWAGCPCVHYKARK